jgi:cytochrome bd-type quinol oxidase subunit 2
MLKNNFRKICKYAIISVIVLFFPIIVCNAQTLKDAFTDDQTKPLGSIRQGAGYDQVTAGQNDAESVAGKVINIFLSILGVVFLILMILGGYHWMTAAGDEQKVTKAKSTITAAIIGLIIVVAAYAITFYVMKKLSSGTLVENSGNCPNGYSDSTGQCK